jgi:3-oxoacyl-[acyl-carrier-protein] synthase II
MNRPFGRHRVVVTGLGLVSPAGIGTEATWRALKAGTPGIDRITLFDTTGYTCQIAGEVKGFEPERYLERKVVRHTARFIHFAVAAARMAVEHAQLPLDAPRALRTGVVIGSGIGGFEIIEREHSTLRDRGPSRVSPFFIPSAIVNLAAGHVSMLFGAKGPTSAPATACTTGAHAIGEAFEIIARGAADAMICGGAEASITPLGIAGFAAMRGLSTRNDEPARASRPWDRDRDGFVVGEGAGVLVLERRELAEARGAPILAEILGYGMSSDAYHVTHPLEDGDGIARVMQAALDDAGLAPGDIDYLNAHATSTVAGDRAEALAIARVFGSHARRLAVSSTKSMTGHLLGAAGALEAAVTILALRDQTAPPTINLDHPEETPLDLVPNQARAMPIARAMTNSFGFGGTNASLILGHADSMREP